MSRHHADWITSYLHYSSYVEAPQRVRFWCACSAVAGALGRKVWIDQVFFKWFPNMYIVIVAKPAIIAKSSTTDVALSLLRDVPEVKFGPSVVTWQALVQAFSEGTALFEWQGKPCVHSSLTIESSELGNFLNTQDREMVNMLITLWDCKPFQKLTKGNGTEYVQNPWLNLIACATPTWIAESFPNYMLGGGFISRCIFVHAESKAQYVAYPGLAVPSDHAADRATLVGDLGEISHLTGQYELSPAAIAWGVEWYERFYRTEAQKLDNEILGGYIARKQTLIHKLSLILTASQSDERVITVETLARAEGLITELEADMPKVFSKIGATPDSQFADRILGFIRKVGEAEYTAIYRYVYSAFPGMKDFEDIMAGLAKAGYIKCEQRGAQIIVSVVEER